jgi:hypothetical protein
MHSSHGVRVVAYVIGGLLCNPVCVGFFLVVLPYSLCNNTKAHLNLLESLTSSPSQY